MIFYTSLSTLKRVNLNGLSSKSNVWTVSGMIPVNISFPVNGPCLLVSLYFFLNYNLDILNILMQLLWNVDYPPPQDLLFLLAKGCSCLFVYFSKLFFLKIVFFVTCGHCHFCSEVIFCTIRNQYL